jgi:phosphoglycerate dehydrogenase-like enzyme
LTIDEEDLSALKKAFPEHEFIMRDYADSAVLERAEIAFGFFKPETIMAMKSLKWLHLPSAGADAFTGFGSIKSGRVMLTNSNIYGTPISEHILALFLSMKCRLHMYRDMQREEVFAPVNSDKEFSGSTVGIIGFGDIGRTLAAKCHALGANVLAVKNTPGEKPEFVEALYTSDNMDAMLPECDFLALCLPNTAQTAGILSRERIASLKKGIYIVNVGRGSAIDTEALIEALRSGHVAAAGLDVTEPEPLPGGNELWKLPNCILSQHTSGRSPRIKERVLKAFTDNLRTYTDTGKPDNIVDVTKGY